MSKKARMIDIQDCLYLNPLDVHFSQDTISCQFSDGKSIGKTLDNLCDMKVFVTDIPPISVVRDDDKYYTRNNRRLWVFRQLAAMQPCIFIPTMVTNKMPAEQFTTDIGGNDILIRGQHGSKRLQVFEEANRQVTLDTKQANIVSDLEPDLPFTPTPRFKQVYKRKFARGKRQLGFGRAETVQPGLLQFTIRGNQNQDAHRGKNKRKRTGKQSSQAGQGNDAKRGCYDRNRKYDCPDRFREDQFTGDNRHVAYHTQSRYSSNSHNYYERHSGRNYKKMDSSDDYEGLGDGFFRC